MTAATKATKSNRESKIREYVECERYFRELLNIATTCKYPAQQHAAVKEMRVVKLCLQEMGDSIFEFRVA